MPLPPPYQGFAAYPTFLSPREAKILVLCWGLAACEREYPLEPTFCDHLCHIFSQAGCEFTPADCVQECEETKGPSQCEDVRQTLLSCYQDTPSDKFKCNGSIDFSRVGVADGACQVERDALYECAAPGIDRCLTPCRVLQTELDPEVIGACALGSRSCEELCWVVAQSGVDLQAGDAAASSEALLLQLGALCAISDSGIVPPPKFGSFEQNFGR